MKKKSKFDFIVFSILFVFVFLIYGKSLNYPFIWDDLVSITKNPNFGNQIYIKELFTGHFFDAGIPYKVNPKIGFYRPIVGISYILNSRLGKTPFIFRFVNLILHFFNAFMLYVAIKKIGVDRIYSFLISVIFTVHPIATGSIVYISGRTDLLKTFFGLLAFLSYLDSKYFCVVVFTILSILSKEDGVMFPFIFVLFDFCKKNISKKTFMLPFISLLYLFYRKYILHFVSSDIIIDFNYCGTVFKSFFTYLRIYFFPYDIHFERFYPILSNKIESIFWILLFFIFYLFLVRISIRNRKALWYLLGGTILFLPVANFFPIYPEYSKRFIFLADHFLYLPGVFIILFVISYVSDRYKKITVSLMSIYIIFFSVVSFYEIENWETPEKFYNVIIKRSCFPLRAYNNLAAMYAEKGDKRCLYYLKKMKKIMNKNYIYYYIIKANWYYFKKDNIKKAIEVFENALKNNVKAPLIYVSLGDLYYEYGDYNKSGYYYEKWLNMLKTKSPRIYFTLAEVFKKANNIDKYRYYIEKFRKSKILQNCKSSKAKNENISKNISK